MQVIINNFRGIQHATYTFESGLTCLTGDSGKGKTTIFEAIKFALYNARTGYAPKDENVKTNVEINYRGYKLVREKKPDLLIITDPNNVKITGQEAENVVSEMFGNQTIFNLGTYIPQGQVHSFINYSAKESMDIISKLALGSEFDVDSKRTVVEYKIREMEQQYNNAKAEFAYLQKILEELGDLDGVMLTSDEDKAKREKLTSLKAQLPELKNKIAELKSELSNGDKVYLSPEELDTLKSRQSVLKQTLVDANNSSQARVYQEELASCMKQQKTSILPNELRLLTNTPQSQEDLQNSLDNARSNLEKLNSESQEDHSSRINEIRHLLLQPDTYDCPNCKVKLTLDCGILKIPHSHIPSKSTLQRELDELLKETKVQRENQNLAAKLKTQIREIEVKLAIYEKLPHPVAVEIGLQENEQRIVFLKQRLTSFPENLKFLTSEEIKDIGDELQDIACKLSMYTIIAPREQSIVREELVSTEKLHETVLNAAKNIVQEIKNNNALIKIMQLENRIEQVKQTATDVHQRLVALNNIKIGLSSAVCEMINTHLNNLNVICNTILARIFDEPIELIIKSFRELADHRIKPQICIEINYKGTVFSGFGNLSGGEKSRISIALLMAFAKMQNKSGLIFMDEVIASLNSEKKEEVVEVLREFLIGYTVVVINHDTTEGIYDNVYVL